MRALRDPAPIDEDIALSAGELERGHDVKPRTACVDLVVDQNLPKAVELAARANRPKAQRRHVDRGRCQFKRRLVRGELVLFAQRFFLRATLPLPIAQSHRRRDEDREAQRRPQRRPEPPACKE